MSKAHANEAMGVALGMVTSLSVGQILFQALGTLALGCIGALGGYLFVKLIKPRLDRLFDKYSKKDNEKAE